MSQDSNVTYPIVRRACSELLGRGEKPARPAVQTLLATEAYLGHKGSNAVVQRFINDFWLEVGQVVKVAPRMVAGVPDEYVAVLDKALVDMVSTSRKIVEAEFADRVAALDARGKEMAAAVEEARLAAQSADRQRLRAEGESSALQQSLSQLRVQEVDLEKKLLDELQRSAALTSTLESKDVEIRHQEAALRVAKETLDQTNVSHREEVKRLLKQVDDERQAGQSARKELNAMIETLRTEAEAIRGEWTRQREANVRLRAEHAAQSETLLRSGERLSSLESSLETAQQEAMSLRVRYETAEHLRQEAGRQVTLQAEDLGMMKGKLEQLSRELSDLRTVASSPGELEVPK